MKLLRGGHIDENIIAGIMTNVIAKHQALQEKDTFEKQMNIVVQNNKQNKNERKVSYEGGGIGAFASHQNVQEFIENL